MISDELSTFAKEVNGEPRALMTYYARLHHNPPRGRLQRQRKCGAPAASKSRAACASPASAEALADMSSLLRGTHHLADEALRGPGALVVVPDAPRPDVKGLVPAGPGYETC